MTIASRSSLLLQDAVHTRRMDGCVVGFELGTLLLASHGLVLAQRRRPTSSRSTGAAVLQCRLASRRCRHRCRRSGSRCVLILSGWSWMWMTFASSPNRPNPRRKSIGVPMTMTRSAPLNAVDRARREDEIVIGRQQTAAHAVGDDRDALCLEERAQVLVCACRARRPCWPPGPDAAQCSSSSTAWPIEFASGVMVVAAARVRHLRFDRTEQDVHREVEEHRSPARRARRVDRVVDGDRTLLGLEDGRCRLRHALQRPERGPSPAVNPSPSGSAVRVHRGRASVCR